MSIDLTTEPGLRPAKAAKLIPSFRADRPTHSATVIRWILEGVRLTDGTRLKLEAVRLPSGWVTTPNAIQRFIEALTADRTGSQPDTVPVRTTTARIRAAARAERELDKIGI
jgi:hypothetical protein